MTVSATRQRHSDASELTAADFPAPASAALPLQHEEAKRKAPETRLDIAEEARSLLRVAAGRQP